MAWILFLFVLFCCVGTAELTFNRKGHSKNQFHELHGQEHIHYPQKWFEWKSGYQKRYLPREQNRRYEVWKANNDRIQSHNIGFARGKETYKQAASIFADQTPEELLTFPEIPLQQFYATQIPETIPPQEVPEELDWTEWTRPILQNRAISHYGWAYSATTATAAQIFNRTGIYEKLSTHELIDCMGQPPFRHLTTQDAFSYINTMGVTSDSHYGRSYSMDPKRCKRKLSHPAKHITSFHLLEPGVEDNLKRAVALFGPVSVNIKVTLNFFFYKKGVFQDIDCATNTNVINHSVLLVGYGTDPEFGDYWLIQNSWGLEWGEFGNAKIARNSLLNCNIASAAIYPVL